MVPVHVMRAGESCGEENRKGLVLANERLLVTLL